MTWKKRMQYLEITFVLVIIIKVILYPLLPSSEVMVVGGATRPASPRLTYPHLFSILKRKPTEFAGSLGFERAASELLSRCYCMFPGWFRRWGPCRRSQSLVCQSMLLSRIVVAGTYTASRPRCRGFALARDEDQTWCGVGVHRSEKVAGLVAVLNQRSRRI